MSARSVRFRTALAMRRSKSAKTELPSPLMPLMVQNTGYIATTSPLKIAPQQRPLWEGSLSEYLEYWLKRDMWIAKPAGRCWQ